MSMTTLTLWQLAGIFCSYLLVTVGLPAFVFGKKLQGHRAPERFLLYFMTGNFYVMNLVFALQLMKISYPVTLILGTLIPAIIVRIKVNQIPVKETFLNFSEKFRRLAGGQMGTKTAIYNFGAMMREASYRFCRWAGYFLFQRFLDCVLIIFLLAVLWYIYGTNLVEYFGYKASDLLVHNYWINALGDNDIFVAGVYPHGFHCVLYYLHAVFGIETFVLLRIFGFVSNVMLHLMLLFVLRLCCRSRYAAYAGTYAFVIGTFFRSHTYSRYYAALPQEFGVIFILPAIYFGFAFFEARRQEIKAEKAKISAGLAGEDELVVEDLEVEEPETETVKPVKGVKGFQQRLKLWFSKKGKALFSPSGLCLAGFCMSFSMTLAVHFYGTMVAGIFCLAMACGYCFLLLRKKYFGKVVSTAALSVGIAVLPMLVAFLGGTPLQGSLGWGMEIIFGDKSKAEENAEEQVQESTAVGSAVEDIVSGGNLNVTYDQDGNMVSQEPGSDNSNLPAPSVSLKERWDNFTKSVSDKWKAIEGRLKTYVFYLPYNDGVRWIMRCFVVLIVLGCFYILLRQVCYGAMLISTGLHMLFMCVLMSAASFGIPALMDPSRGSIYFSYCTPVALAFVLDGVLYLPFCLLKGKAWNVGRVVLNGLSLACVVGLLYYTVATGQRREPRHGAGQEMNETVICLTNIIKSEKDFTWTIVSANDELRMGWDHGYHYETITFLQEMEKASLDTLIRIPTRVVYFFIEKIPVDYNVSYIDSGQSISEEGASYILPGGNGIGVYQGRNRWILMSRMYYWAEAFQQFCPNEMEVYMETDSFICYRLEQEPYRLYNFALDYGYNDWGNVAEETAD